LNLYGKLSRGRGAFVILVYLAVTAGFLRRHHDRAEKRENNCD
jgi:hypothetical protein